MGPYNLSTAAARFQQKKTDARHLWTGWPYFTSYLSNNLELKFHIAHAGKYCLRRLLLFISLAECVTDYLYNFLDQFTN